MDNVMIDQEVALLNDRFRKSGFGVTLTCGVQRLSDISGLMQKVRMFSEFNENNDPYGEHDMASLVWQGSKVFWKIDYYNDKLTCFEEPLSPTCKRVMTVMLAEEY